MKVKILAHINKTWKTVTATLTAFPKKDILAGVTRYNKGIDSANKDNREFIDDCTIRFPEKPAPKFRRFEREKIETHKNLKLANHKRMWWIYYDSTNLTGHFDSRQRAIDWFVHAGR